MPIISADRPEFTLVHPTVPTRSYLFRPSAYQDEGEPKVLVVHTAYRIRNTYRLTTEEARQLWRRLRQQGYERF